MLRRPAEVYRRVLAKGIVHLAGTCGLHFVGETINRFVSKKGARCCQRSWVFGLARGVAVVQGNRGGYRGPYTNAVQQNV